MQLELKNDTNYVLQETLTLAGTGWPTFQFSLPANAPPINFIAFSGATSDFEVSALYFTDTPPGQPATIPNSPEIIQTSPSTSATSRYLLTYTVNGFLRAEWVNLIPGLNIFRRTFIDALGQSIACNFQVTLN